MQVSFMVDLPNDFSVDSPKMVRRNGPRDRRRRRSGWKRRGVIYSLAGYVVRAEQRTAKAVDVDVAHFRAANVGKRDALGAGAGDVGKSEALNGTGRHGTGGLNKYGNAIDADIAEAQIAHCRDALIAPNRKLILLAAVEEIDSEKTLLRAGDIEPIDRDAFNKCATAGAGLDVDGKGVRCGATALLDAYVADAAGGFAANADAGPVRIREGAIGDEHIFCGTSEGVALLAAAGFERDAIVARNKVAGLDKDMAAGIDVDAIGTASYCHVAEEDVVAIDRVNRPHLVLLGDAVHYLEIGAIRKFEQCGITEAGLLVETARDIGAACDAACAGDVYILRIDGRDECPVAFDPAALPADLRERVIGEVGRAEKRGALIEAKMRVGVERDGADNIVALRYEDFSAAEEAATIESLLEGERVFGCAVAGCAEIANVKADVLRNGGQRTGGSGDAVVCGGQRKRSQHGAGAKKKMPTVHWESSHYYSFIPFTCARCAAFGRQYTGVSEIDARGL